MSQCCPVLLRALQLWACLQSKKGPGTPSVDPRRVFHKHGVSEALLNYSQEGLGLYQTRQALCHRVGGLRHRHSLGEKPPKLTIGGKAPNIHLGGKAPRSRENPNMETIARTPLQLGNYIRQRRRELGLTQEKLAAKVGVRQRTVSDIETSAAVRFDTVLRTLAALDLELVIRPRSKGSARDIERLF